MDSDLLGTSFQQCGLHQGQSPRKEGAGGYHGWKDRLLLERATIQTRTLAGNTGTCDFAQLFVKASPVCSCSSQGLPGVPLTKQALFQTSTGLVALCVCAAERANEQTKRASLVRWDEIACCYPASVCQ